MSWLGDLFEKHFFFRRMVISFFCYMYFDVTCKSFEFSYYAIDKGISAQDILVIMGALQAMMTLLMGYAFKIYSERTKTTQ